MRLDGTVTSTVSPLPTRTRWGVLSTGQIASAFTADLALLPDEADLVAVGSRELARAEQFADRYGFRRAYGSYPELAADPDLDVIYIATPHNDHHASARLCLEAGKSVLVEKPLTVTVTEAEDLITLARQRGLFCMEAMWSRCNPRLRKAAQLVAAGELGPIRHLTATVGFAFEGDASHRLLNPDLAGGAILDMGVYPVHAVNLFLGEPDQVLGFGSYARTGVDANAAALLTYPATGKRPAVAASIYCTLEADAGTPLKVLCSNGRITFDNYQKAETMMVRRGHGADAQTEKFVTQSPGHGFTFQAQEVMRCLRAGELESPLVPWQDTLATMRTLTAWRQAVDASDAGAGHPEER